MFHFLLDRRHSASLKLGFNSRGKTCRLLLADFKFGTGGGILAKVTVLARRKVEESSEDDTDAEDTAYCVCDFGNLPCNSRYGYCFSWATTGSETGKDPATGKFPLHQSAPNICFFHNNSAAHY